MATYAMKAVPVYWNGSAYTYDGEGQLGIPDGTETMEVPSKGKVTLPVVPVPSSVSFRMMSNPLQNFFDSETIGSPGNFNVGFN